MAIALTTSSASARKRHVKRSEIAQKALGIKGKMIAKKNYAEKAQMKKTSAMHNESSKTGNETNLILAKPCSVLSRMKPRLKNTRCIHSTRRLDTFGHDTASLLMGCHVNKTRSTNTLVRR